MNHTPDLRVLPRLIDARKMAHQGSDLVGIIPIRALDRLQSALESDEGDVSLVLSLGIDQQGLAVVTGTVKADVLVLCQRCLSPMTYPVDTEVSLAIVPSEERAKELPKRLDPWFVTDNAADLYSLVEDEILLALPMVAYHQQACLKPEAYSSGDDSSDQKGEKPNPFSVLEQLKGSPK
ncbi:YceD family protein [Halioxenophilus sp. WMMB6]|uniref:YceD family protein n=1 Tax=Halioxenophilus sp. WMMB6 TaxID=3073815 RepID=UPI00295E48BD|nr:YceD family protein [Halioxenophilus sp. WMMB6]